MPRRGIIEKQELIKQTNNSNSRLQLRRYRRNLRDVSNPFSMPEKQFMQYFRIPKLLVIDLINEISMFLADAQQDFAIPKFLKVLTALQFYAHGSYQKIVGKDSHLALSQSSVSRCIQEVTEVFVDHFLNRWIHFPDNENEIAAEKAGFMQQFNFVGIVGVIDGTHVALVPPSPEDPLHPGHLFINRKGFHSLNVQIVCNANLRILSINARHPGSVHDSAIFLTCGLRQILQNRYQEGD